MLGMTELKIPAVAGVLVAMALTLAWAVAQQGEWRVAYFPEELSRSSLLCSGTPAEAAGPAWLAAGLRMAHEPSLYAERPEREHGRVSYRFTWARPWDPLVVIRVDELPSGSMQLRATELSRGAYGKTPGIERKLEVVLSGREAAKVRELVRSARILELAPADCRIGPDGTRWIVEAATPAGYRLVNRWSPDRGPFFDLGAYLVSLTRWKFPYPPEPWHQEG